MQNLFVYLVRPPCYFGGFLVFILNKNKGVPKNLIYASKFAHMQVFFFFFFIYIFFLTKSIYTKVYIV